MIQINKMMQQENTIEKTMNFTGILLSSSASDCTCYLPAVVGIA